MSFVIDHATDRDLIYPSGFGRGYDRDMKLAAEKDGRAPVGTDPPAELLTYKETDWPALFKEQEDRQSSLWHLRHRRGPNGGMMPSLDQNGQGYCWTYSNTAGIILRRAAMGMPYVRLSAHSAAWRVKGGRDEGGWCGLSAEHLASHGVNTVEEWAEKSMSSQYDTAENRQKALDFRVLEGWWDVAKKAYDRNLTRLQIASLLFNNIPVAIDFDEWGHSIVAMRWVEIERGSWGPLIWNSWTDQWGDKGEAKIQVGWTIDGATAVRSVPGVR